MARTQEIATRIASLNEMLNIFAAIRAMAASQLQQGQHALAAVRKYSNIVSQALSEAAGLLPPAGRGSEAPRGGPALVIFGSEHGFCGSFNRTLLQEAQRIVAQRTENTRLIVVGTRAAQQATESGSRCDLTLPMATHCAAIATAVRRVTAELYQLVSAGKVIRLEMLYTQQSQEGHPSIRLTTLLPLAPPATRDGRIHDAPLTNLRPRQLFDELAAQYLFTLLAGAAMESFTSENFARFRAMDATRENVQSKSTELAKLGQQLRQEAVTSEILELISATEAMKSD